MDRVGVICKIEHGRYFVLTDGGDFVLRQGAPPAGKALGDRVVLSSRRRWLPRLAVVAALALMIVSSLSLFPVGAEEFSLTLDINPSVELIYDEQAQLRDWRGVNSAGQEILQDLEQPRDLYIGLSKLFSRCLDLGLVQDAGDIFITVPQGAPVDDQRLLGSFEGRGASMELHVVQLPRSQYRNRNGSALRNYLHRQTGADFQDAPQAEQVKEHLAESVTSVEVSPWLDNPVVQALVEDYSVSGALVEELLTEGVTPEEVANLLALAQEKKLSPRDVVQSLLESELSPGEFIRQQSGKHVQAPDLKAPPWLAGVLAVESGHPTGQLASYMRRGTDPETLQALVVLESINGGKLQSLVKAVSPPPELAQKAGVDGQEFTRHVKELAGLVGAASAWAEDEAVVDLAQEFKASEAEVLYILGRGYDLAAAREVLAVKRPGNVSVEDILSGSQGDQRDEKPDQGNPGQGKGKETAPGQQEPPGKQNPPGKKTDPSKDNSGQGKGRENAPGQNKPDFIPPGLRD